MDTPTEYFKKTHGIDVVIVGNYTGGVNISLSCGVLDKGVPVNIKNVERIVLSVVRRKLSEREEAELTECRVLFKLLRGVSEK